MRGAAASRDRTHIIRLEISVDETLGVQVLEYDHEHRRVEAHLGLGLGLGLRVGVRITCASPSTASYEGCDAHYVMRCATCSVVHCVVRCVMHCVRHTPCHAPCNAPCDARRDVPAPRRVLARKRTVGAAAARPAGHRRGPAAGACRGGRCPVPSRKVAPRKGAAGARVAPASLARPKGRRPPGEGLPCASP